jgi:hypothetical protein
MILIVEETMGSGISEQIGLPESEKGSVEGWVDRF